MIRTLACVGMLSLSAPLAAAAATAAQASVAAMSAYERAHGQTDIEQPTCYVVQGWAQCVFITAHGNLDKYDWLHLQGGKWTFLGGEIGNPAVPYMKKFGVPAAVAAKFEAHCKC